MSGAAITLPWLVLRRLPPWDAALDGLPPEKGELQEIPVVRIQNLHAMLAEQRGKTCIGHEVATGRCSINDSKSAADGRIDA